MVHPVVSLGGAQAVLFVGLLEFRPPVPRKRESMLRRFASLLSFVAVAASTACNGPLPFLGGGALPGDVVEPPENWSEWTKPVNVIQLETNPTEAYSVNIAYTIVGEHLYVYAGDTKTKWVEHMEVDPNVRFRREGNVYELRAERVTDDAERLAFAKAWAARGFFSRDPQTLDEVWLYRLKARE